MERGLVKTIISTAVLIGGLVLAAAGVKEDSDCMMYGGIASFTTGACIIGRRIAQDSEEAESRRVYEEREREKRLDATSYY